MEKYTQGLHLKTSQEMFFFTASETLFMVSMALCYFYTWQTYSLNDEQLNEVEISYVHDVYPVEYGEAVRHMMRRFNVCGDSIMRTSLCVRIQQICEPVLNKLETVTGFGGNLNSGSSKRNSKKNGSDRDGYENLDMTNITEDGSVEDDEERKMLWPQNDNDVQSFDSNLEMVTANTLSDIEEESTIISDTASNFSNNSRNF